MDLGGIRQYIQYCNNNNYNLLSTVCQARTVARNSSYIFSFNPANSVIRRSWFPFYRPETWTFERLNELPQTS